MINLQMEIQVRVLATHPRIKTSLQIRPRRLLQSCRLKDFYGRFLIYKQGVWTEGNAFQAGEGGSSRKRGASPATNPSSKRRKEEGGSVNKETPRKEEEEMALATTPRPPPMRKKAILKMAEKTSLTPQPMEMCSPSPTRRLVRSLKEPSMMPRNIFC